jgi:hypothetical protein
MVASARPASGSVTVAAGRRCRQPGERRGRASLRLAEELGGVRTCERDDVGVAQGSTETSRPRAPAVNAWSQEDAGPTRGRRPTRGGTRTWRDVLGGRRATCPGTRGVEVAAAPTRTRAAPGRPPTRPGCPPVARSTRAEAALRGPVRREWASGAPASRACDRLRDGDEHAQPDRLRHRAGLPDGERPDDAARCAVRHRPRVTVRAHGQPHGLRRPDTTGRAEVPTPAP